MKVIEKITEDLCVCTDYLTPNVSALRTQEGLVLFDSPCLPKDAMDWSGKLKKMFKKDIAYLINTHHHFDHIMGNCFLTRRVIAQEVGARGFHYYYRNQESLGNEFKQFFPQEWKECRKELSRIEVIIPQIVFKNSLTLSMGDKNIILKYVGGHCPGAISIYIPEEKVLIAGDNIENGRHPMMGFARYKDCLNLLKEMEELDIRYVIPGHGKIGDKSLVNKQTKYFEEYIRTVKDLLKKKVSLEEMIPRVTDHMMKYLPEDENPEQKSRMLLNQGVKVLYEQLL